MMTQKKNQPCTHNLSFVCVDLSFIKPPTYQKSRERHALKSHANFFYQHVKKL